MSNIETLAAGAAKVAPVVASTPRLITWALIAIALIVVLIAWAKVHPFIALLAASLTLAIGVGVPATKSMESFTSGFGSTMGGVGALVALGAIVGNLLLESGGANTLVDRLLQVSNKKLLPLLVALIAAIIGIPMFFEIGVVLLVPLALLIARRSKLPVMLIGLPMLFGLGEMHALVPPHPGPLAVVDALHADLGLTMMFGLPIALLLILVMGPIVSPILARFAPVYAPEDDSEERDPNRPKPKGFMVIVTILLPVILMLLNTVCEIALPDRHTPLLSVIGFLGTPLVALLVTVIAAFFTLGLPGGMSWKRIMDVVGGSFAPIAGVLLIVGAGGGFKQTLVDIGAGGVVAKLAGVLSLSAFLMGWIVAALIRMATGSATVAALTAVGLVSQLAVGLDPVHLSLLVLAIGLGSGFLSHVNDAGFWLVKEYFGLTVGQTFKTWSLGSCIASVLGLAMVACCWVIF